MFNVCVECAIPHNMSKIIPSFKQSKIVTVYRPRYNYAIKKFINISGCNSLEYNLYDRKGLSEILQTGYTWRIIYRLKPTGL